MSCKFCESLQDWRDIYAIDNMKLPKEERIKQEYTVALLIYSWCPKYKTKRQAGRTTDYRNQGLGYKLNYCPECGKKLRG